MQLFLTSSVHAVAHDIAKRLDLTRDNKLVFIDTAVEPKGERDDLTWLARDRQSLVDAGFAVGDYTITGKSVEQLRTDLAGYNYLYLSGGDTVYLLEQSQRSGFVSLVKALVEKGVTYIGTSAGSIIAGPTLPRYLADEAAGLENMNGYGFVNFTVVPHWGSEGFRERYLTERLKKVYTTYQTPLLLLTDTQYVHIQGDQLTIHVVDDKL
jgi:dipeptidase E